MLVAAFETVNFKRQKETYLLWHSIVRILQHYFLQFGSTPFGTKPVIMKRLPFTSIKNKVDFQSLVGTVIFSTNPYVRCVSPHNSVVVVSGDAVHNYMLCVGRMICQFYCSRSFRCMGTDFLQLFWTLTNI